MYTHMACGKDNFLNTKKRKLLKIIHWNSKNLLIYDVFLQTWASVDLIVGTFLCIRTFEGTFASTPDWLLAERNDSPRSLTCLIFYTDLTISYHPTLLSTLPSKSSIYWKQTFSSPCKNSFQHLNWNLTIIQLFHLWLLLVLPHLKHSKFRDENSMLVTTTPSKNGLLSLTLWYFAFYPYFSLFLSSFSSLYTSDTLCGNHVSQFAQKRLLELTLTNSLFLACSPLPLS